MNALNESARIVDTSWCKGNLREEAVAKDKGDTYCAVGAMAEAFSKSNLAALDWGVEAIGTDDNLDAYIAHMHKARDQHLAYLNDELKREDAIDSPMFSDYGLKNVYTYIGSTAEGLMLAKTIVANYPERTGYTTESFDEFLGRVEDEDGRAEVISDIIVNFNDADATQREDVVAMMEKAAVSYDDAVAFEDKTSDDLVAEIDELLDA